MTFSQVHDKVVNKFPEYGNKDYRSYGVNRIVIFLDKDKSVIAKLEKNGSINRRLMPTWFFGKDHCNDRIKAISN